MTEKTQYHILTPEGVIPHDIFVLADQQPLALTDGCLLVVHQSSGKLLTVNRTRLIPVNDPSIKSLKHQHSVCMKCGKVEGIVLDKVTCPHHDGTNCGLMEHKS